MYVTLEEQHYRSDCCKNRQFWLRTDTLRLPPFQIMTTNGGSIGGITLYDTDGNVVANAGITDLANNHLIEQTDCTTYWYMYDGILDLAAALPLGDYYIVVNIIGDLGSELWYSEVFTVCDCDVVPTGFEELLVNGNFLDWTADDPDGWTTVEAGASVVTEVGSGEDRTGAGLDSCCLYEAGGNTASIEQDILTVGDIYVVEVYKSFRNGANNMRIEMGTGGTQTEFADWFVTPLLDTYILQCDGTDGIFKITTIGNTEATMDYVSVKNFKSFEFCSDIVVEWWNDCDFEDIIYQTGYHNRLYFDEKLASPREEITKDQDERLGENFEKSIILKKFYQLRDHVPEYIYNMMIRWPLYDNVYITLPSGESAKMEDINITSEWQDKNCYNHITVEFTQGPLVKGQCCENFDIMDESSCI